MGITANSRIKSPGSLDEIISEQTVTIADYGSSKLKAQGSDSIDITSQTREKITMISHQELRTYSWTKRTDMYGKVISIKAGMVVCECLLDPDERIFETRSFPKLLFENISNLSQNPYVYISIQMRPGVSRIDIKDGSKSVDKKLFEANAEWDELLKDEISKPLTKPVGYDKSNL